jgi:hypothetical protein
MNRRRFSNHAATAIRIKPHHFVDIITALGRGKTEYTSHPYGHALDRIAEQILRTPQTELRIELGADDICAPCVKNIDGICRDTIDTSFRPDAPRSKQEWNLLIDRRWCERLGIFEDEQLTAVQLCLRLRQRAGDITAIYREIAAERTANRAANLKKGVELYLNDQRRADH